MINCVGLGLLIAVIVGGIYLYMKVERLNREIALQAQSPDDELDEQER